MITIRIDVKNASDLLTVQNGTSTDDTRALCTHKNARFFACEFQTSVKLSVYTTALAFLIFTAIVVKAGGNTVVTKGKNLAEVKSKD